MSEQIASAVSRAKRPALPEEEINLEARKPGMVKDSPFYLSWFRDLPILYIHQFFSIRLYSCSLAPLPEKVSFSNSATSGATFIRVFASTHKTLDKELKRLRKLIA